MNKICSVIKEDYFDVLTQDIPLKLLWGRNILITGAAGMLASYLIDVLLQYNDTLKCSGDRILITGVARNRERVSNRFAHTAGRSDLKFIIQDVVEPLMMSETYDYILHAASNASPIFYKTDPVGTLMANIEGTRQLLEYGRKKPVSSFLLFSSAEVYGQPVNGGDCRLSETLFGGLDPAEPRSCYAEGKRAAEAMGVAWWNQYGVPVKIVRPFHVYGPGMKLDDGRVFADFVRDVVYKRDIVLNSDGLSKRAFCYLSDAVRAFIKILLCGNNGIAYNVGNPDGEISIGGLADILVDLYPDRLLRVKRGTPQKDYMPSKVSAILPDISRITQLGWKPKVDIRTGFEKTIRSFER